MADLVDKLFKISFAFVVGLAVTHPRTWRVELAKVEYRMLKESITAPWGCPSLTKGACEGYDSRHYR